MGRIRTEKNITKKQLNLKFYSNNIVDLKDLVFSLQNETGYFPYFRNVCAHGKQIFFHLDVLDQRIVSQSPRKVGLMN